MSETEKTVKDFGEALAKELPKGFYGKVEYNFEDGQLVMSKLTTSIK